ncbi:MAG TPA: acyltransferase [Candidatus Binatus sp.]|nr:acyltransferase [Candidatus Binatus sp.]
MIDPSARVHPSADVEDDVSVGAGTSIWHRAQVRRGARIGAECVIGRDAFIDEGVELGDRVKIQNGALVYHGVTVEDGVFIGPGAILTNDRFPRSITATGELARADDWSVSPIVLRRGSSIGAGAVVVAGNEVGTFATVGAGSVVTRFVAPHALVVGNPARVIGWVCACGQRLLDEHDAPASADLARVPAGQPLHCPACGRSYAPAGAEGHLHELVAASPRPAMPKENG